MAIPIGNLPESVYSSLTTFLRQINERFVALKNLGYEPIVEPPKAELGIGTSDHRHPKADFQSKTKSSSQSTSPTVPSPSAPENSHSPAAETTKKKSSPSNKSRSALRFKYCF